MKTALRVRRAERIGGGDSLVAGWIIPIVKKWGDLTRFLHSPYTNVRSMHAVECATLIGVLALRSKV